MAQQQFLEKPKDPETLEAGCRLLNQFWDYTQSLKKTIEKLEGRVVQLEERIEQLEANSTNSSNPPSQDRLSGKRDGARKKKPSGKKKGAQEGHVRNVRPQVPESEVDEIQRHFPDALCPCGGQIEIHPDPKSRHQIFDLPKIIYTVTEHQSFSGVCPCCHRTATAKLPQEIPTGQMGPGLIAWIALMSGHYRMSTRNIQNLMAMQWGLRFSIGAISEAQEPMAEWLKPLHQHIGDTVRSAPVAHADETTHFRGSSRLWLWVLCTTDLTYFMVHASRGMKAARELLGDFAGILISDRNGGYNDHPVDQRQICWAHILRNLERNRSRTLCRLTVFDLA